MNWGPIKLFRGGRRIESLRSSPQVVEKPKFVVCPIDGQKLQAGAEAEEHADNMHAGITIKFVPCVK